MFQALADLFMDIQLDVLTWVVTWHFSSKNLLCKPSQTLRLQYNAVPMWLCQVSSIHIELCITPDLNNRFEVFFYGRWVWFRWWLTVYIDSIFFWFDPRIFNTISFIFLHTSEHLYQVILLICALIGYLQNMMATTIWIIEMVIEVIILLQSHLFWSLMIRHSAKYCILFSHES